MKTISVLLVDDEIEFVEGLAKVLCRRGLDVETATEGVHALDLVREKRPDVVVLDLKMPGMNGLQVLSEIRRISPLTRVVLLTGHLSEADEKKGLESGAFAYLLKPQPISDLVAVIDSAAAGRRGDSQ
jgi:DNA-binding response OmpR family regulator